VEKVKLRAAIQDPEKDCTPKD